MPLNKPSFLSSLDVGIDAISLYTPDFFLPLNVLAEARNVDPQKFSKGLGQENFSMPSPDEDSVTMACAAISALGLKNFDDVDWLIFATESGVDQSKAAGLYVHQLLSLPSKVRTVEFKQACYGGVAGLNFGLSYVQANPSRKVILVCSDVARYPLNSAAESSQGAAAVAVVLSAFPSLIGFYPFRGAYTEEKMDFWRPSYSREPFLNGSYSCQVYISFLEKAYRSYCDTAGAERPLLNGCCYHAPFSKLVHKAHAVLSKEIAHPLYPIEDSLYGARHIGNCYAASLFLSLYSFLQKGPDFSAQSMGFYSYGSGSTSEFFSGLFSKGYKGSFQKNHFDKMLQERQPLDMKVYQYFHSYPLLQEASPKEIPVFTKNPYRLSAIGDHQRFYQGPLG
jgi:hydroxymethylglutaryl-CoA synthase